MNSFKVVVICNEPEDLKQIEQLLHGKTYIEYDLYTDVSELPSDLLLSEYDLFYYAETELIDEALDQIAPFVENTNICLSTYQQFGPGDETEYKKRYINLLRAPASRLKFLTSLSEVIEKNKTERNLDTSEVTYQEYLPVKPMILTALNEKLPFSIYISLSQQKFIRIVEPNAEEQTPILEKYLDKGFKEFYLTAEDFQNNQDFLFNSPMKLKGTTAKEKNEHLNEFLQDMISYTGINEVTMNLTDNLAKDIAKDFPATTGLGKFLLNSFQNTTGSFAYKHSYLTSMVCAQIAKTLEWDEFTVIRKLITASLLHDCGITSPKLICIHDLQYEEVDEMSKNVKKKIHDHGQQLVEVLKDKSDLDGDILYMIENHHEKADGSGYQGKNAENLRQILGVFIIAHDFVLELFRTSFKESELGKVVKKIYDENNRGNFAKPAEAFLEAFSK